VSTQSAMLNFVARLPIDGERHFIPKSGIYAQTPKWYQFKARSMISEDNTWLGCLHEDLGFHRTRLILADEGGVGKTKSAAICANYLLNNGDGAPVLILVEPRQRKSWYHKLRRVLPRHQQILWKGSAGNTLKHPKDRTVYVCSKYSLHKHIDELKSTWKPDQFSLVVIDECHKNKPRAQSHEADIEAEDHGADKSAEQLTAKKGTGRNYQAEKTVCTYARYALGITASPLGIQPTDVWYIGEKIGIPEPYRAFFGRESREQFDGEARISTWKKWAELNQEHGLRECLEEFFQSPNAIEQETWEKFVAAYSQPLSELLPVNDRTLFVKSLKTFDYSDQAKLFELLSELNPFSPFMSITLRSDLGGEADELFRTMRVNTLSAPFPQHALEELNGWHQDGKAYEAKRLHSHPAEMYKKPESSEFTHFMQKMEDPRFNHVLGFIQKSINNRQDGRRGGMVIFADYLDTVNYIKTALETAWKDLPLENKPHLVVQRITGETDDIESAPYLHDDGAHYAFTASQTEFHLVIGTSAIEQGVDMPWADVIVHWDLHPNPRTLEQRTWRLDRHNEAHYATEFEVVYFWTGFDGLKEQLGRMMSRIELYDQMLGRPTVAELWPGSEEVAFVREYTGDSKSFIHQESTELAETWRTTLRLNQGLAEHQQINLFRWVANRSKDELDEDAAGEGQLRLKNGAKDVDVLQQIRKLALYADGHDREALAELSLSTNHDPKEGHWLGVDGFSTPTDHRRVRTVTLNPKGVFMGEMLRKHPSNQALVTPSLNGKTGIIFSIDPVPLEGQSHSMRSLSEITAQYLRRHDNCDLHHLADQTQEPRPLNMEDEHMLLQLLKQLSEADQMASAPDLTAEIQAKIEAYKDQQFEQAQTECMRLYERLVEERQAVEQKISDLESQGIESSEDQWRMDGLERQFRRLDHQIQSIADCLDRELSSTDNFTVNLRLHEVSE
jgi:hypothetical protein